MSGCKLCGRTAFFNPLVESPYGGHICANERACDVRQLRRGGMFALDVPPPTASSTSTPPPPPEEVPA